MAPKHRPIKNNNGTTASASQPWTTPNAAATSKMIAELIRLFVAAHTNSPKTMLSTNNGAASMPSQVRWAFIRVKTEYKPSKVAVFIELEQTNPEAKNIK